MTDPGPPFQIGSVDGETLTRLLAFQAEADWLDYKGDVDLSATSGTVELAKDVGAMSMFGGYLVVGARNDGKPLGRPLARPELFDLATLGPKLSRYITGAHIRTATHRVVNQDYVLICVLPHPDGFAIFTTDGTYPDPKAAGKSITAFRAGDVYTRRHSKSERWRPSDLPLVRERLASDESRSRETEESARRGVDALVTALQRPEAAYLVVSLVPIFPASGLAGRDLVGKAQEVADRYTVRRLPTAEVDLVQPLWASISAGPRAVLSESRKPDMREPYTYAELSPDGSGVAAMIVGRRRHADGAEWTAVLSDRLELEAVNLVDLLIEWARSTGSRGDLYASAGLYPPQTDDNGTGRLIVTAEDGADRPPSSLQPNASKVQGASRHAAVIGTPFSRPDAKASVTLGHALTRGLLNAYGVEEPSLLRADGLIDTTYALNRWRRQLDPRVAALGVLFSRT